jgi:hypothetical protein
MHQQLSITKELWAPTYYALLDGYEKVLEMLSNQPHTKTQVNLAYPILKSLVSFTSYFKPQVYK